MAEFNANLGKISISEENVIDPSHSPVIETVEIGQITTTYPDDFVRRDNKNAYLLVAGCVLAMSQAGELKHFSNFDNDEDRLVVLVNDVDTEKDSAANVMFHGTIKGHRLWADVNRLGILCGNDIPIDIKRKLRNSGIYVV